MKSLDVIKQEINEKMQKAMASSDPGQISEALAEFAEDIQKGIMEDFQKYKASEDSSILANRGIRQLTGEEKTFYNAWIDAAKNKTIEQSFTGTTSAIPTTIIDSVIEGIKSKSELLADIKFINTGLLAKLVVNDQEAQLAIWGPISSEITQELNGAVKAIDLTQKKLTAFLPVSKDMLEAGPEWIDAYVRAVLVESNVNALEKAVITGTGNNEPIGLDRDVSDDVSVSGGVYPQKEKVVINDLEPATFGKIAATLAKTRKGRTRAVTRIGLIVNPVDYWNKIMPRSTFQAADGTYRTNVFPMPTKVYQSTHVAEGTALFVLPEKYLLAIGLGAVGGRIEQSDHVRFLEDERVYITKMFGDGVANDDNAAVFADISGMTAAGV